MEIGRVEGGMGWRNREWEERKGGPKEMYENVTLTHHSSDFFGGSTKYSFELYTLLFFLIEDSIGNHFTFESILINLRVLSSLIKLMFSAFAPYPFG